MKFSLLSYILCSSILLLSSCVPSYVPNVINTPLHSGKGEFQAAIYTGTAGFDPQLSYAISDHAAIMLNGSFANRADSTDNFHIHNFIELGGGYYSTIGSIGRFEFFGGVGTGDLEGEYENSLFTNYAKVNSTRLFLQPAIGINTSVLDASLAARLANVHLNQDGNKDSGTFFEPVITAKIGYKYVKAVSQLGLSLPFNEEQVNFSYQPFVISIGLQGRFGGNQ